MGRIIRTQLAGAVVGLMISAGLAHLGAVAAFAGLTGTSVVMAVAALAARSPKVVPALVALALPFASVTALEQSLGKSLSVLAHGPSDGEGGTTLRAVYKKYRENSARPSIPSSHTSSGPIDQRADAEVSPASLELSCLGKKCGQKVTIRSTGTAALRLTSMAFEGEGATVWHRSNSCEHKVIPPGRACTLRVRAVRSEELTEYAAQLVIHQSTPAPACRVDLSVPTDTTSPEPAITNPSQQPSPPPTPPVSNSQTAPPSTALPGSAIPDAM